MTRFEPRTSGIKGNCSANWATTTTRVTFVFYWISIVALVNPSLSFFGRINVFCNWGLNLWRAASMIRAYCRHFMICLFKAKMWYDDSDANMKSFQFWTVLLRGPLDNFFNRMGLFFFIFVFSIHLTVNNIQLKLCQWRDSNLGPLVPEATALPTERQPLTYR